MHEADRKLLCIPLSPNMHNCSPSKMVEDAELRKADRVIQHLSAIYKSYNRIKAKKGRYLLLESTLEGGSECLQAVKTFRSDPKVLSAFKQNATSLLQGQLSRSRYNTCLGLLAARLIYL